MRHAKTISTIRSTASSSSTRFQSESMRGTPSHIACSAYANARYVKGRLDHSWRSCARETREHRRFGTARTCRGCRDAARLPTPGGLPCRRCNDLCGFSRPTTRSCRRCHILCVFPDSGLRIRPSLRLLAKRILGFCYREGARLSPTRQRTVQIVTSATRGRLRQA